jgi:hypothetical protein
LCKPAWSPSLFLNLKPPKIHFYFSCRPISQEFSSEDSKSSHLWLRKHLRDPLWHQRIKKESEVAQFQSLGLATENFVMLGQRPLTKLHTCKEKLSKREKKEMFQTYPMYNII